MVCESIQSYHWILGAAREAEDPISFLQPWDLNNYTIPVVTTGTSRLRGIRGSSFLDDVKINKYLELMVKCGNFFFWGGNLVA